MNLDSLVDRFGASSAEPVHLGLSGASVVRLLRGGDALFHQEGPGVDDEADRLAWLGPRIAHYIDLDNSGAY